MKTRLLIIPLLLVGYMLSVSALADYMRRKPFEEKIGYLPTVATMKVMSADQKEVVAASILMKVLMYYGGLVERTDNKLQIPADYPSMSRTIHAALKLDPYNMDGYYFAQAILTWDVGKADLANSLLEYGMKYRTWDWYLPFYAGFNYAYFLKDYEKAAAHYRRAADLTGNELFISLAGRYMKESGRTDMAIAYLDAMAKSTRQEALKKTLNTRKSAFLEVRRIEQARDAFVAKHSHPPGAVEDLVVSGFLQIMPHDPYGGSFYFEPDGRVASTSGFSFAGKVK